MLNIIKNITEAVIGRRFPPKYFNCHHIRLFQTSNLSLQASLSRIKKYHDTEINFKTIQGLETEIARFKTLKDPVKLNDESIDTSTSIGLREYQKECIDTIIHTLSSGKEHRIAISIATGGGKTVIFSMAIPRILEIPRFEGDTSNGVLILVHRRELASQTIKTIQNLNIVDDDRIFLDMGKNKIDPSRTFNDPRPFVIVGSVPTLARVNCARLSEYRLDRLKAVIVDECHHAVSASYKALFEKLGCSKENNDETGPFLLGFTATMARADKVPLKKVFDKIVFQKHIASLIEENHLCDFEWSQVKIGLNLQDVEVRGGDFQIESLSKHVNTTEINIIILKTYLKLKQQYPDNMKSLLVFCVNVEHMQNLSHLFRENGINAQYVSGETKSSARDKIVADFKNGDIPVLFNCGVFTEGTDIPNIDSIFLLRPTKSKPLLIQMIGRGLRLSTNKEKLLVLDFVDSKSVGLSLSSTLGGKPDVISLMGSLGGTGFNHRDELLPADVDYIKFTNYKGLEMLYAKEKRKKPQPYELLKHMKAKNRTGYLPIFTQIKFDTWACSAGNKSYFKVEITKEGKYQASYAFRKQNFEKYTLVINKLVVDDNIETIWDAINAEINKYEFISEEINTIIQRENNMRQQAITKSQSDFIGRIVPPVVESTQSYALDYVKFLTLFSKKLEGMSRLAAYQLIFSYTLAKKQAVMLWLKENFLKNKEQRALITKDSVLKEKQEQIDGGWN